MTVIRQITYEFDSKEDLDRQLNKSWATGVHKITNGTITIKTLVDEREEGN